MKFYNGGTLLGMRDLDGEKPEIFISSSNRTAGKTTYFNRYAMKRFKEKGSKFMLVYRHINELDNVEKKFFKDIGALFYPGLMMGSQKGAGGKYRILSIAPALEYENTKEIPWTECGYAVALSAASDLKKYSHLFSDVDLMIFDEFQDEYNRYLKGEVDRLISLHVSVARGQGQAVRYVPLIMISNPVSMLNPYYTSLGVTKRLDAKTKFLRGRGWVMEQGYVEEAKVAQEKSRFNVAFEGRKYMAYSGQGVYLSDSQAFVEKMTGVSRYCATLVYSGEKFSVRYFPERSIYYIKDGADESFPFKLSVSVNDHNINQFMCRQFSFFTLGLRKAFDVGAIRFQSLRGKECLLDMLS